MKGNILIVDDTPENLQVLSATLSREGYKVRGVVNGTMALRVAKSGAIDLILLDIKMPDMNGYEVCEKLKADATTMEIPVIFISALDATLDKVRAFQVGGVDYITKPFQVPEVLARVENQLTIRQLQQKLQQQNQQLQQEIEERKKAEFAAERALQVKSEFLTNMSHELRTPLNVILGFTQLMNRDAEIEDEQRENLQIINRSGEHLLDLINDILDLSKIESGAIVFQERSFDLYQLLDHLEAMFLLAAERKGIRLDFAIATDVPQYIKTDEKKLRGCLINLLNNAIKFTDSGSVMLRVSTMNNEQLSMNNDGIALNQRPITNNQQQITDRKIYFTIEDTGCGIAAEEIDGLFEAFVQAEAGRRAVEGTGLGLTITRQFITLMGGEISVWSSLGKGSTFKFYIVPSIVDELPSDRMPPQRIIGLKDLEIAYRILVVDDTRESCLLLKKLLQPIGFDVREAINGKEAISIWETWHPHLIFMDTRMPVMNGYEATREIRRREATRDPSPVIRHQLGNREGGTIAPTIIIALTASIFEEQRGTMLEAGCNDFIHKPFQEVTLLNKIATHLGVSYHFDNLVSPEMLNRTAMRSERSEYFFLSELKKMPQTWLKNLYRYANEINEEVTLNLIKEIHDRAPALAEELQDLYEDSRFDIIVRLAKQVTENITQ
ncbi:MAG: response regulator [Spirulina sp.]